jgi:hypothetical protein
VFVAGIPLAPGRGLEVVGQQFDCMPGLIPIPRFLLVLEVEVLECDPREVEDPVKQGMWPEVLLGCD